MNCQNNICNRAVFSTAVTFTGGNLVINIPTRVGNYVNNMKYCLFVIQAIPDTTTISAPVYITIGTDAATLYPVTNCSGTQITAGQIKTRKRYTVRVATTPTSGSFQILGCLGCSPITNSPSLPVAAQ